MSRMSLRERLAWALATIATATSIGLGVWVWRLQRGCEALMEERDAYYNGWCDAERELEILRIGVGAMEPPEEEPAPPPIG